jgi:hypothetical protein
MPRDVELRLRAVQVAGSVRIEIWVQQEDGLVRSPRGEQMTFEEAEDHGALSAHSQSYLAKWT